MLGRSTISGFYIKYKGEGAAHEKKQRQKDRLMSKQTDRQWGISVAEMTGDSEGSESQVHLAKCHSDHLQVKDTQSQVGGEQKGVHTPGFLHRGPPTVVILVVPLKVNTEIYVLSHSWALQSYLSRKKGIGKLRNCTIIGYFLLKYTFKRSTFATWNHKHERVTQWQ